MSKSILKLNCEVTYDTEEGIEVCLKHSGILSREVMEHFTHAGDEVFLALGQLAGTATRKPQEKVRTKIAIEEA
ncbi:MAG: hypothetical protein QQM50_06645 [Dehalococcoides mccartyi]|uniref:hypothetical protein n=1 Tax=Dehalococcoides TaxID=61434 RepID=UPI002737B4C6|nr:hypothetical protein [Dehalococcoides mccartyi]MDP4280207.1 hypothetical protein [Dehalococcoides mccartyi]